jgi:hypothetical protein
MATAVDLGGISRGEGGEESDGKLHGVWEPDFFLFTFAKFLRTDDGERLDLTGIDAAKGNQAEVNSASVCCSPEGVTGVGVNESGASRDKERE